jgi:hypothetical protein
LNILFKAEEGRRRRRERGGGEEGRRREGGEASLLTCSFMYFQLSRYKIFTTAAWTLHVL